MHNGVKSALQQQGKMKLLTILICYKQNKLTHKTTTKKKKKKKKKN